MSGDSIVDVLADTPLVPLVPLVPGVPGVPDVSGGVEPVVVDVLDHHGRAITRQRIMLDRDKRTFTIGRSVRADIMIDDPHAAPIHAEVSVSPDGMLSVTDRGSINGIFVGHERHRDGQSRSIADGKLQIGRTPLRIHTAHQPMPAEKPDHGYDHRESGTARYVAIAGAIACVAIVVYFAWVGAARDTTTQVVIGLAAGVLISAVWISFWTLLSRIIRGEPRWQMHAAIAFGVTAVGLVVDSLFDIARFSFALPQWSVGGVSLLVLTFAVALYLHLAQVWTLRRRTGAALAAVLPLLIFGTISWVQERSEARNVNFIGVREKVFPPAFQLRDGRPLDRYFTDAAKLREEADSKRKEIPADDTGGDSDEE